MITSSLHLNLSRDDQDNDRRCVGMLYALPAGSRVVLFFGNRRFWEPATARLLSEYVATLHLEVQASNPETLTSWTAAIAGGGEPARWSA